MPSADSTSTADEIAALRQEVADLKALIGTPTRSETLFQAVESTDAAASAASDSASRSCPPGYAVLAGLEPVAQPPAATP